MDLVGRLEPIAEFSIHSRSGDKDWGSISALKYDSSSPPQRHGNAAHHGTGDVRATCAHSSRRQNLNGLLHTPLCSFENCRDSLAIKAHLREVRNLFCIPPPASTISHTAASCGRRNLLDIHGASGAGAGATAGAAKTAGSIITDPSWATAGREKLPLRSLRHCRVERGNACACHRTDDAIQVARICSTGVTEAVSACRRDSNDAQTSSMAARECMY